MSNAAVEVARRNLRWAYDDLTQAKQNLDEAILSVAEASEEYGTALAIEAGESK